MEVESQTMRIGAQGNIWELKWEFGTNCDDVSGPFRAESGRKTNWLKCLGKDLSTRSSTWPTQRQRLSEQ